MFKTTYIIILFVLLGRANNIKIDSIVLEDSTNAGSSKILSDMIKIAENGDLSDYSMMSRLMSADASAIRDSIKNQGYYSKDLSLAYIYYRKITNGPDKEFSLSLGALNSTQQCIPKNIVIEKLKNNFTISLYTRNFRGITYVLQNNPKTSITFSDINSDKATCASAVYIIQSSVVQ